MLWAATCCLCAVDDAFEHAVVVFVSIAGGVRCAGRLPVARERRLLEARPRAGLAPREDVPAGHCKLRWVGGWVGVVKCQLPTVFSRG